MYKKIIFLYGVSFFVVTTAFAKQQECRIVFSNGQVLAHVPVARTVAEQEKGLSNRTAAGQGMLFVWPSAEPRVFWMHDTHVPLEVGFFDRKGKLFSVQAMTPDTDTYHFSRQPALSALELAHGDFAKYRLSPGVVSRYFCMRN